MSSSVPPWRRNRCGVAFGLQSKAMDGLWWSAGLERMPSAGAKKVLAPCRSRCRSFVVRAGVGAASTNRGDKAMRVMVMVKATKDSEAGAMPSTEMLEAMGKYNEELIKAGVMLAGEGLHPSAKGKRVAFDGPSRTVIDGPFAETRELVAGFWLWEVRDMAEALAWVKRCPNPMPGPSELEIRPILDIADFGDAVTPEVAELHDRNREKVAGR